MKLTLEQLTSELNKMLKEGYFKQVGVTKEGNPIYEPSEKAIKEYEKRQMLRSQGIDPDSDEGKA